MRKKPTKKDLENTHKLTEFMLRNALTIPSSAIIKRINEGHTQSMIAREFKTSRSAVSQRVKTLKQKGLLTLTLSAGGSKHPIYAVHLGSLRYPLSKPVKLPFDVEQKFETLTYQEWSVKGHRIRQNIGSDGTYSLEIFGIRYDGQSIEECENSMIDDCRGLYDWLVQLYPELAKVSNPQNYKVNRPGKLTIHALKGTAERALKARGGGQIILDNVGMIDDSLKDGGEFHIFVSFMKNLATKQDIQEILEIQKQQLEQTKQTNELTKQTNEMFKDLLGNVRKIEKPPSDMVI